MDAEARLAVLVSKLDGLHVAIGIMRSEVKEGFVEVTRQFERHEREDDDRFERARLSIDTKVAAVYAHVDNERRHLTSRAWAAVGVVLAGLGVFTGIIFAVIPWLTKVK